MKLSDIMTMASGGVGALAPVAFQTMPRAAQVLAVQRYAACAAEQAAAISRVCGDALAIALREQVDVVPPNVEAIRAAMVKLQELAAKGFDATIEPATVQSLGAAYGRR